MDARGLPAWTYGSDHQRYPAAICSWLRPGIGRCAQPDSPYVVRPVAPNAHADAHQGPAITLRTILITAPFFSQLIIFRIILWRIRVAKATSKTTANSDVVQSGIEFNAATRSTAV